MSTRRRLVVFGGLAVLLGLAGASCGGGEDDYFAQVDSAAKEMSVETQRAFGDGEAVTDCDAAARRSLTAAAAGCRAYFAAMTKWVESLSDMRASVGDLVPPERARDWHVRYLAFLDSIVYGTTIGIAAFERKDYRTFLSASGDLPDSAARLDLLLAELQRLR